MNEDDLPGYGLLHDGEAYTYPLDAYLNMREGGAFSAMATAVLEDDGWFLVPSAIGYLKEIKMEISADYEGKIKRIGKQFLLQLGCQEFICQNLNAVGSKVTEVLTAEYKKRDKPEDE